MCQLYAQYSPFANAVHTSTAEGDGTSGSQDWHHPECTRALELEVYSNHIRPWQNDCNNNYIPAWSIHVHVISGQSDSRFYPSLRCRSNTWQTHWIGRLSGQQGRCGFTTWSKMWDISVFGLNCITFTAFVIWSLLSSSLSPLFLLSFSWSQDEAGPQRQWLQLR